MMLLRGATLRRLCAFSVRPFTTAVDVGSRPAEIEGVSAARDPSEGTRYRSFRESNRSRTRARVEGQLHSFLRSRNNEAWSQEPPREAYWLLRSCGSDMILETMATRMELANSMWEEFQKQAPLPVGMYNTLLQVYLQNDHRFDPAHFLEEMEKAGVLPNQGTLVGILSCCCNEGDIEGATKILDQMRSLDMEINENIYASLITGHCRRGDMENGEGMLKVMQENGLCPTATSYAALLCGHADRGGMDRVEQLLEEMRERRVFPSVGVYSSLLDRLSLSGHSDLLPRALDVVPDKQLLYNDLYDQACKCTVRRDNKGTLIMLRCLATLVPRTTNIQLGAILIRTMASQGRMLSEMMVMVAELQSLEFGHHVYEEILHSLHTRHDDRDQAMADALSVLQDMPRHGVVVKEHYFYPNLAYYAEKGDLEGAVRGVALMKEAGLKLRRMSFRYLLQASREGGVASESDDVIGDMDRLLAHIKGTPLMLNLVNEISVFLLDRGMFARAVELLTSVTSEPIDLGPILKAIKNGVNHSKVVDVPGLVSVYVALHSLPSNPDLSRSVAITTSILVQTSPDLAKQFIEELSGNGVDPGEHAYHTLLHSYATPDTVKEFHAMMKCLQSRGMVLRPSIHKQMLELAADMGDPVRAGQAVSAIRRSGQRLSATAFSRYIVANAKSRRIGTALELYERMRSHDLRPSYEAMNHLMVELLRWGDVHGAENMRRDLEEMGYFPGLVLRNAFLGAYSRRDMSKALQEFEALKTADFKPTAFSYNELMTGYSLHGDIDSIRGLFDELQREGIPLDRSLVSRLFDAYVTRGDIDGGLSLVEEFPGLPPHSSSLMAAMQLSLEAGDEEMVERVRRKMNEVSGEKNTDNMMFFGHLRAGQVTQSNKILETEGFSLNSRDLVTFVVDMKRKRKRDEVYTALELLRDKGHHLGDKTSVAWLRVYDILGDVELALALKEELTSAGHTLSDDFLSRLESITTRSHSQTRARVRQL